MRTAICAAMLLFAVPALGADARADAPPVPPPATYEVWGFRWDGRQYVKPAANSLRTTNLTQAADYAAQITRYAGWSATTNLPAACVVHTTFRGPAITAAAPSEFPAKPAFSVWAFKQSNGKWVKDEAYSWTTTDPLAGLEYAKKVNAVPGWTATDNCPEPVPEAQRYVNGGTVQGADAYWNFPFHTCDAAYGPSPRTGYGRTLRRWNGLSLNWNALLDMARYRGAISNGDESSGDYSPSTFDISPTYDNSSDIQNMINTQDMINNQNMLNNIQDMVNTQNMINTQNMVNSMQDAVNQQNMINAMQANP